MTSVWIGLSSGKYSDEQPPYLESAIDVVPDLLPPYMSENVAMRGRKHCAQPGSKMFGDPSACVKRHGELKCGFPPPPVEVTSDSPPYLKKSCVSFCAISSIA